MVLLIDTTADHVGVHVVNELHARGAAEDNFELVDTTDLNISHCLGCNYCWLKTPGVCVIKDDYEPLLRKFSDADQVWLISDTRFGFISHQTKNIVDRIMPIITMYLTFKGGQMRHVMRYDHQPDIGVIYTGDGDRDYLNHWCERTALNMGSQSLGAFATDDIEEAVTCMS